MSVLQYCELLQGVTVTSHILVTEREDKLIQTVLHGLYRLDKTSKDNVLKRHVESPAIYKGFRKCYLQCVLPKKKAKASTNVIEHYDA